MKVPFVLKDEFYKSMFIRCFYAIRNASEFLLQTLALADTSNRAFLHLNGVYLKDFYVLANRVPPTHFAKNDISGLRSTPSRTVVKYRISEHRFTKSQLFSLFSTFVLWVRNRVPGSLLKVLIGSLDRLKESWSGQVLLHFRSLSGPAFVHSLTFSKSTLTPQAQLEAFK
jgi:hypothetical protein